MNGLQAIEIKAFVPAKDFTLSRRFYADLGFQQRSEGGGVAYFQVDGCAFLLQDIAGRYGVRITPLTAQPWGITEFVVIDPAGVCWHIGQNTPGFQPVGRLTD